MNVNRRAILAGIGALVAAPSMACERSGGGVIFCGNSFTRQHNIPCRVAEISARTGRKLQTDRITKDGASLLKLSRELPDATNIWQHHPKPAGVLQDFSVLPVTRMGRGLSAEGMDKFAPFFDRLVLFETWPRRAGHALYSLADMPPGPEHMAELVHEHYQRQAHRLGATLAPVGQGWLRAMQAGLDLHARDGYHANESGAHLTALVLAHALGIQLPENDPMVQFVPT